MVAFDKHCPSEVLTEGVDRCPPDGDSGEQLNKPQYSDEITPRWNTPDADEAYDHADRLNNISGVPELRGVFIPIFSGRDSMSAQVRVLNNEP